MHALPVLSLTLLALLVPDEVRPPGPTAGAPTDAGAKEVVWDARAAQHLLSRAGFGARPGEIERALERGLEATVAELLGGGRLVEPPFVQRFELPDGTGMDADALLAARSERRREDRAQMDAYEAWWLERMLAGDDPLRDRMTLLWHGFFTSSYLDVRQSHEMIAQHRLLRDNALESYATLLRGIVRDPAMLRYLDNDRSRRRKPNENLARELLELFSLGEGNYTEQDVGQVARALTGHSVTVEGEFRFNPALHDRGRKRVLGQRGPFDGNGVVELLLRQPACARHVAGRILTYLEGVAPDDARLEEYAGVLRAHDYELAPLLEKLFTDPRFYRAEIVGARVASPIDFLVGISRRLDIRPPLRLVSLASADLGQALFQPPSVKGWEEGPAWITTASMLQRGNVAGLLLGTVDLGQASGSRVPRAAAGQMSMDGPAAGRAQARVGLDLLRALGHAYRPAVHFTWRMRRAGAASDRELATRMASDLLAITPPEDTLARLARYLEGERLARGIAEGALLEEPAGEEVLRRLAHLILSSPEAQLH